MPDLLFEASEIALELAHLKHKAARVYKNRDLKRMPALRSAVAELENKYEMLIKTAEMFIKKPPKPPVLRKSYSYDFFEDGLIRVDQNGRC